MASRPFRHRRWECDNFGSAPFMKELTHHPSQVDGTAPPTIMQGAQVDRALIGQAP